MASIVPVLLLGLFLNCVSSVPWLLCKIENSTMGGNFTFNIRPEIYKPNTTYTVTISGFQNGTMIALSASTNNTSVGSWDQNSSNCSGVYGVRNGTANEQWTSPAIIENYVKISAYVDPMGNGSYVKEMILKKESLMTTPMSNMTATPNNATVIVMTTPMSNMTATPNNATVIVMTTPMSNMTATPNNATVIVMTTPMSNMTVTPNNATADNKVTTPMMNTTAFSNTSTTVATEQTTKSTGNVISFKLLHGFACMLLLVMVPELL